MKQLKAEIVFFKENNNQIAILYFIMYVFKYVIRMNHIYISIFYLLSFYKYNSMFCYYFENKITIFPITYLLLVE